MNSCRWLCGRLFTSLIPVKISLARRSLSSSFQPFQLLSVQSICSSKTVAPRSAYFPGLTLTTGSLLTLLLFSSYQFSAMAQVVSPTLHFKCRNTPYISFTGDNSPKHRFPVPDEKVPWTMSWPEYDPPDFTIPNLAQRSWADPEISEAGFNPQWNVLDGNVNRSSHVSVYELDPRNARPLNPRGRTGMKGRGRLGRWGPNHAADPIVTTWKRDEETKEIVQRDGKGVLMFVGIQRVDTGEWAIPGGMVDPGEVVTRTLKREFLEEALDSTSASRQRIQEIESELKEFFESGGIEVYRGYVDDPRNTDNAWMETVAVNFHDESGAVVGNLHLEAGDDAAHVSWIEIAPGITLYASHREMIQEVAVRRNAFW